MCVPGVQFQRGVGPRHGPIQDIRIGGAQRGVGERLGLQGQFKAREVRAAQLAATLEFRQFDLWRDAADDVPRNLVLQREDVGHVAVVTFAPDVAARIPVEELGGDPEAVAAAPDASLEHVAYAKLARDLSDVERLALVGKGRVARYDE